MKGLRILDEIRWHERWSAAIGTNLRVEDSTNDMFFFSDDIRREEILGLLKEVPDDLYQLLDVEVAPEEDCDFKADSGRCYRALHS